MTVFNGKTYLTAKLCYKIKIHGVTLVGEILDILPNYYWKQQCVSDSTFHILHASFFKVGLIPSFFYLQFDCQPWEILSHYCNAYKYIYTCYLFHSAIQHIMLNTDRQLVCLYLYRSLHSGRGYYSHRYSHFPHICCHGNHQGRSI